MKRKDLMEMNLAKFLALATVYAIMLSAYKLWLNSKYYVKCLKNGIKARLAGHKNYVGYMNYELRISKLGQKNYD